MVIYILSIEVLAVIDFLKQQPPRSLVGISLNHNPNVAASILKFLF